MSETMDGWEWDSDPTAHVLSANVHRRHLTKGQQAMATALVFPDDGERGRGKKSLANNDFSGASSGYIRQARFVLRHCRDKAEEVLRNAKYPLTVATVSIRWRITCVPGECCAATAMRANGEPYQIGFNPAFLIIQDYSHILE